ncbi:haloacid dehalogenase type II [Planotetraspora phitsanulokensis]|uniref:Haloacid dehalogenase n=1 Tax=Planotetraspora phitsanulokensis TaxID=575192 RepID=A0A8J3UAF7_9ACTN|nr:haloacid dehalogenase type II [Planotetraspora phitsanulokensis]GII41245.1 haloacid dehalogenase [Planotetraspora phitsanulokensis]
MNHSTPRTRRPSDGEWAGGEPAVLVFDVNETLIDFESMSPLFEKIFGDRRVMREWLGHLFMYSMTVTLSGLYEGFFTLGQGLLKMVGDVHGVEVADADVEEIRQAMLTMPAHPDVEEGLTRLGDAGFRMVTLTNSPPNPQGRSPLEHAGLARFFERQFSVETTRAFKPAPQCYHMVAQELDVPPSSCCMIAAHVWDTMGAQSAGFTAGLITRPGNAPLPVASLPQPDLVAPDLPALAGLLISRRRP